MSQHHLIHTFMEIGFVLNAVTALFHLVHGINSTLNLRLFDMVALIEIRQRTISAVIVIGDIRQQDGTRGSGDGSRLLS